MWDDPAVLYWDFNDAESNRIDRTCLATKKDFRPTQLHDKNRDCELEWASPHEHRLRTLTIVPVIPELLR
jgi:hypothetical protein